MFRMINNIFKYKNYKICFDKILKNYNIISKTWKEVDDSYIIYILNELKKDYFFNILKIDLRTSHSTIYIRCKKEDIYYIFFDFCMNLSGYIKEVNME